MDLLKYSSRLIDSHLLDWKDTRQRKPLLLRGARQVGKSSIGRGSSRVWSIYKPLAYITNVLPENSMIQFIDYCKDV
jgi:predicted AAA+ superfamily ATPase